MTFWAFIAIIKGNWIKETGGTTWQEKKGAIYAVQN